MDRFAEGIAEATVGLMMGTAAVIFMLGVWVIGWLTAQQQEPRFVSLGQPIGDGPQDRGHDRARAVQEAYWQNLRKDFGGGS